MSETTRFCMVHGSWGSGKTWLGHTMPGPRIVMDTEGGWEDVPVETKLWDIMSGAPMPEVGDDTSVVVEVTSSDTVYEVLRVLEKGDHPFRSFVVDSLTESQKQTKTAVSPNEVYDPNAVFDHQSWGRLFNHGELMIRRMRDLTRPSSPKRMHGLVLMGSDIEAAPIRPLIQGGLRKHLAGFFRLEGYLFSTVGTVGEYEGKIIRVMNINSAHGAEAKCNLHKLNEEYKDAGNGYQILNPNMAELIAIANKENN